MNVLRLAGLHAASRPPRTPAACAPSPSTIGKSCACPPGNSTPSIVPVKSTCTRSPRCAARSTGAYVVRCLRSTSSVRSTSCGVTSATGRVIAIVADVADLELRDRPRTPPRTRALRSAGCSPRCGSMRGVPATRRFCARIASLNVDCTRSEMTSERTCGPYCWSSIRSGTLPGRKPGDLDGPRKPRQPLLHFAFDVGDRHGDVQPALERRRAFRVWFACETESLLDTGSARAFHRRRRIWCERGDSNPHGLPRQLLRLVRLPIPPLSRMRRGDVGGRSGWQVRRHRMTRARARGIAPDQMPPGPRAESASISDRGCARQIRRRAASVRRERAAAHSYLASENPLSVGHYENFPVASALAAGALSAARSSRSTGSRAPPTTSPTKATPRPPSGTRRSRVSRARSTRSSAARPAGRAPVRRAALRRCARTRCRCTPFRDLLSAFAQDVDVTRYATFADARRLLPPLGQSGRAPAARAVRHRRCAEPALESDAICTALQLANFWQDVAIDWRKGRVYIPLEDLDALRRRPAADRRRRVRRRGGRD